MAVKLTSDGMKSILDSYSEGVMKEFMEFQEWREKVNSIIQDPDAPKRPVEEPSQSGILQGPVETTNPNSGWDVVQVILGRVPTSDGLGYYNILYRCTKERTDVDRTYPNIPKVCGSDLFTHGPDSLGLVCWKCSTPIPKGLQEAFQEHNLRLERENDRG